MPEAQYWNALVPELTVGRLESSLRFYHAAGFSVRFQRADPPFAYLELGDAQIMLEEEHAFGWSTAPLERPFGRGVNFQIEVENVEKTRSTLEAAGYTAFEETKENWYAVAENLEEGQREFLTQDPDGYLLRFAQYLGRRHVTA